MSNLVNKITVSPLANVWLDLYNIKIMTSMASYNLLELCEGLDFSEEQDKRDSVVISKVRDSLGNISDCITEIEQHLLMLATGGDADANIVIGLVKVAASDDSSEVRDDS